jgi:RNA polymerase-binding transcription factor DksA
VDNPDATDDPTTLDEPDDVAMPAGSIASEAVDKVDTVDDVDEVEDVDDVDLDAVERDLLGVEVALERLDAGTYRTDELDGRAIPDEVLERDPIARRAP